MSSTWLPAVLMLFCGSGAAALIYEIVWLQLLQLVLGSSTTSVGVLLGTFMGGLCLGSLAAPALAARVRRPLRAYAWLELLVAAMGLALLGAMPLIDRIYALWGGEGPTGLLLRALLAGACLLPPTLAMGAALPIVARSLDGTRHAAAWLGWMYAANTIGAVGGAVAAGFYLLRVHDMAVATFVAVGLNVLVAAVAFAVPAESSVAESRVAESTALGHESDRRRERQHQAWTTIHTVIAISGFCALAAEVVWTRLLALLFGATVYTFSIILVVFLIGLGAGSGAGAALLRKISKPAVALGACQWLAACSIAWSGYMLASVLPFWSSAIPPENIWQTFRLDLVRAVVAILPAPLMWGASFPLALASIRSRDVSRTAARVYAANTFGAIAGALVASLVLVGQIGTQRTEWLMIAMSAAAGALLVGDAVPASRRSRVPYGLAALLAIACAAVVPRLPGLLVAYGRHAANWSGHAGEIVYVGEGSNSSVAVSRTADGVLNYHNAGKIQASSEPQDMRLQRMLGHLTTLVPAAPRSVLVIGCGAGVTAGAVSLDPRVERVTIAEIEPLVPRAAEAYFGSANANVIRNPKVRVRIDDARHFLLTTKEKFDAITSDPLDPWVKGAATLYTTEFFELAKAHLNPGGVMTLFVQLYESSPDTVRSEAATFFGAFPNGIVWGNTYLGVTADTVLLGQVEPPLIDVDGMEYRLAQPAYADVRRSLGEIGFFSAVELLGSYGGRAPELGEWLRDAPLNRDLNLRLQYLAGFGFNLHAGDRIYADILKYRSFPDDLFSGSSTNLGWLKEAIEGPRE